MVREELVQALDEIARDSISLVRNSWIMKHQPSISFAPDIRPVGGHIFMSPSLAVDTSAIRLTIADDIRRLPSFQRTLDMILADPFLRSRADPDQWSHFKLSRLVDVTLEGMFSINFDREVEVNEFPSAARSTMPLLDELYSDTFSIQTSILLKGFTPPSTAVILDDAVVVDRLSAAEASRFVLGDVMGRRLPSYFRSSNVSTAGSSLFNAQMKYGSYCVVRMREHLPIGDLRQAEPVEAADASWFVYDATLAFQLALNLGVRPSAVVRYVDFAHRDSSIQRFEQVTYPDRPMIGGLSEGKTDSVRDCWTLVSSFRSEGNKKSKIALALKRFHDSWERPTAEDRLIDLMISCETILTDDRRGENANRVARGARNWLRPADSSAHQASCVLKAAYELRNSIVHSGSMDLSATEIEVEQLGRIRADNLIDRASQLTSLALEQYLRELQAGKLTEEIDRVILR